MINNLFFISAIKSAKSGVRNSSYASPKTEGYNEVKIDFTIDDAAVTENIFKAIAPVTDKIREFNLQITKLIGEGISDFSLPEIFFKGLGDVGTYVGGYMCAELSCGVIAGIYCFAQQADMSNSAAIGNNQNYKVIITAFCK